MRGGERSTARRPARVVPAGAGLVTVLAAVLLAASAGARPARAADPPAPTHAVGLASVDITPGHPVRLSGFGGRSRESQGVRLPIRARAIAIGPLAEGAAAAGGAAANAGTVVVIAVETLGIPAEITERLAARLAVHGITRDRLALCATHTHSAPMIRGCANTLFGQTIPTDQWGRILAATAALETKLEEVALAALADRRPSSLARSTGRLGFAFNRRTAGGPVDHDLPLLVVRDADGGLRGLFSTYACHCVTLSDDLLGGDWAGAAALHLERRHPGCVALLSIGCGADSDPRGGVRGSDEPAADLLGREYADEVDRLVGLGGRPITAAPAGSLERVSLPLAPLPSREEWVERARQPGAVGHHARTQLERLDRGEALVTTIDYPVQAIRFGDELAWLFLPGEVVVDYATRLKRELDGGRVWIHAYANACPGYVPSERILGEGGYEGGGAVIYYDIPAPYAPGLEARIVTAVLRQAGASFSVPDASRTGGSAALAAPEALATFRVAPGFRVELVAAEPMLESPVAVAFGPDGRSWVAEMADYPTGTPDGLPGGRIRCLHDDDGDGIPERSSLFLEGIPFPTGVTPWRDGLLVCAAPDILLARDGDGDGRAEEVVTVVTGFATHNFQARVNGLEYGLDGWLEGACGLFGGDVTSTRSGAVTALGGRDFRLDPDAGRIEPAAGSSQQGRVRNDAGDFFGCNNGTFAIHFPLPDRWLRRNPFAAPRRTAVGIASEPGPGRLFPISEQVLFALSGPPGRATAACGVAIYRDDLLAADGRPFTGDLFTCEPVANLVHHQTLVPDGATFKGARVRSEGEREFLASTDPWFRPVQARTAPDGSLWIVDMGRYVIEHPVWIPPETLAGLDVRAGAERGRIWRVVATEGDGGRATRPVPRLDRLSGADLAAALDTPNGTVRDLVQQSIVWRDDREAVPALVALAATAERDVVRLQSLCTLATLGALPVATLSTALADPSPAVRRQAVRLATIDARPGEGAASNAALAAAVAPLAADPSAAVRLQVAAGADSLPPERGARVLVALAEGGDDLVQAAAASALSPQLAGAVLEALHARPDAPALPTALDALLAAAAHRVDAAGLRGLLEAARRDAADRASAATFSRLAGMLGVARRRGDGVRPGGEAWEEILAAAAAALRDGDDTATAAAAAALLGHGRFLGMPRHAVLVAALDARTPPPVLDAVLAALRDDGDASAGGAIVDRLAGLPPAARQGATALLLERKEWAVALLDAIDAGRFDRALVDLAGRQTLLAHPDEALRTRAGGALGSAGQGAAGVAIGRYAEAARRGGDPEHGAALFTRHCAPCHRVDGVGETVGPDIASHAGKPVEAFVTAILDPHSAVDPRYEAYVALLEDGRAITGAVVEESASSLVLLGAGAIRHTLLRGDIAELRGTGKSLMPEGFERVVSPVDVADLWAWFARLGPAPKAMPGNAPAAVMIAATGAAVLPASAAEIRGGDIVFETEHANVGMWHGVDDSVRWRVESAAAREVEVWAEMACDPAAAGNRLRVEGMTPAVVAEVVSTGAWSRYALVRLGRAAVGGGVGAIVVRADGALRGALVDLRAIHLVEPGTMPHAIGGVDVDSTAGALDAEAPDASPAAVARVLLDEALTEDRRGRLIEAIVADAGAAGRPADILRAMAEGLPEPTGSAEEYRRIPSIWRLAVAVGKGGDGTMIRETLAASLPDGGALAHWQAVVLGGGIVNGAGLAGRRPGRVVDAALGDDAALAARWRGALEAAGRMADDPAVPDGTRYDALRMIALMPPHRAVPRLERVLAQGAADELVQGAVSGLVDVEDEAATAALLAALPGLAGANRDFAIRGLVRDEAGALALLGGISAGRIPADVGRHEAVAALRSHPSAAVQAAARRVLGE